MPRVFAVNPVALRARTISKPETPNHSRRPVSRRVIYATCNREWATTTANSMVAILLCGNSKVQIGMVGGPSLSQAHYLGAKCRYVQNNHHAGEKVHAHHQADCDMHSQNSNEPHKTRLSWPDENRVRRFHYAHQNSEHRKNECHANQDFRRNQIEWRTRQRSP